MWLIGPSELDVTWGPQREGVSKEGSMSVPTVSGGESGLGTTWPPSLTALARLLQTCPQTEGQLSQAHVQPGDTPRTSHLQEAPSLSVILFSNQMPYSIK